MTDAPLVEKKLALVETCVADLRRLALEHRLEHLLAFTRAIRGRLVG
jgi:hypothetical protein